MMKVAVLIVVLGVIHYSAGKKLGEDCANNDECRITNQDFTCKQDGNVSPVCKCIDGKKQHEENCIDVLQSPCKNDGECFGQEGVVCESNFCVCKNGLNPENKKCVSSSSDGKCQNSLECRSFLGENSVCKENACACQENYHNYNKKCIASKHLNEACESDGECYQQILTDNALRCNLADKKCICREPFKADGDQCSKGNLIISSFVLLLIALIAKLY